MNLEIGEVTLKRARKCRKNFQCLSGEMEGICQILNAVGTNIVLTDCPERGCKCDYCEPFDSTQGFCTCPTRRSLYHRHGI